MPTEAAPESGASQRARSIGRYPSGGRAEPAESMRFAAAGKSFWRWIARDPRRRSEYFRNAATKAAAGLLDLVERDRVQRESRPLDRGFLSGLERLDTARAQPHATRRE